jgi:hypothetical protein
MRGSGTARSAALLAALAAPLTAGVQGPGLQVPERGALVYERTTQQFAVEAPPAKLRPVPLIPGPDGAEPQLWRHWSGAAEAAPHGFEQPGFDDRSWPEGAGSFGPGGAASGHGTEWSSEMLCVCTKLDLGRKKPSALLFVLDHDDGVRVWLNGRLVVADDGHGHGRNYVVAGKALDAWQAGENTLALRCTNIGGAQFLGIQVSCFPTLPRGLRNDDELLAALREEREAAQKVHRELFGAYRMPPLLLHGDLDASRRTVRIPPGDLRDLAWWLAMDVRCGTSGGSIHAEARRLFRLGDLKVRGTATATDADGWQTLTYSVKNTPEPAAGTDGKRHVERFVVPHVWYGFDGTLTVRRRLVPQGNDVQVTAFETSLTGNVLRGKQWKETAATLEQREVWRLTGQHENQDVAFRLRVGKAIEMGTNRLREQLKNLDRNNLEPQPDDANNSYHGGRLAIGLLALVKGGVPKDDPVVQAGFAELRQRPLLDTYSLANALMAVEALYAPESEQADLRSGTIDRPRPRQPSAEDKALMAQWVAQLLGNADTRVDAQQLLRFHYRPGPGFDNSLQQYGVLGLYSAHLCGVDVPGWVWEAAANHQLSCQATNGYKIELGLTDYRTHAQRGRSSETTAKFFAYTNGWSYHGNRDGGEDTPVWGSMVCAGLSSLSICQSVLQESPRRHGKLFGEIQRARNDAFAWLAEHMTMRQHPGAIERQPRWLYYYLYSLERAALLSGIALIQGRDWYFEGAMVLVSIQNEDGNWPPELMWDLGVERNAMAILFLKQSTRPVLTGR